MSRQDRRYAVAVCVFMFLAMGFVGWLENDVPTPQPSLEQMVRECDRNVPVDPALLVKR